MAEHVWSVLCYKGCLDKYTNQVSLLDVVEQLTLKPVGPLPGNAEKALIPSKMHLVSLWERSALTVPEIARSRLTLRVPDGSSIRSKDTEVDLVSASRCRSFLTLEAIPYHGVGLYRFIVEQYEEAVEDWKPVASVPLEVRLSEEPSPKSESHKSSRAKHKTHTPK